MTCDKLNESFVPFRFPLNVSNLDHRTPNLNFQVALRSSDLNFREILPEYEKKIQLLQKAFVASGHASR